MSRILALASALLAAASCRMAAPEPMRWRETVLVPGASLRAVAAPCVGVLWCSGSGGAVLVSVDGGKTFAEVGPADMRGLDFRAIAALDDRTAVIASAGTPARICRTEDRGASWTIVHEDQRPSAFFDALTLGADGVGYCYGDPIGGEHQFLRSADGGRSWRPIQGSDLPPAAANEAAFAASNSCLVRHPDGFLLVTGGGASCSYWFHDEARAFRTRPLPMPSGPSSAGAFSVAMGEGGLLLCVGGDYAQPSVEGAACWSEDQGRTWRAAEVSPAGYRSGVAMRGSVAVAVGERGSSVSRDRGRSWQELGASGFHAVVAAQDGFWAVGAGGRLGRLEAVAAP